MKIIETPLKGAFEIIPKVFEDPRGYFFEAFNLQTFKAETGIDPVFVQDNESYSSYGVIRGLHFQKPPYEQAKLIRAIDGEILDVIVDLRKDSPTFGQSYSSLLNQDNKKQLFVPRGFAHGFAVLSKIARIIYKCDSFYAPDYEGGIIYNDPTLKIDWMIPEENRILSKKDLNLNFFKN